MATYYVAQTAAGSGDGSTYPNRMSVATHNGGGFSADDVIYLCDTITSRIIPPSSGSSDDHRIIYRGDYPDHAGILDGVSLGSTVGGAFHCSAVDYLTVTYVTIQNTTQSTGQGHGVFLNNSDYVSFTYCTVDDNDYNGFYVTNASTGWLLDHCTVSNNDMSGFLVDDGAPGPGTIRYSVFDANGQSSNPTYCTPGDTGSCFYHGVYLGVETTGTTELHHNEFINTRCGAGVKVKSSVDIHHNYFYNNSNWNLFHVARDAKTTTQRAWYNIFVSPNGYGIGDRANIFFYSENLGYATLYTYNNALYDGGLSSCWQGAGDGKGPVAWYIKNNIIQTTDKYCLNIPDDGEPGTTVIDYNLSYRPAGSEYYWGTGSKTFTEWQTLGFDTHGFCETDPLFVDGGGGDFRLQSGSPCRDTGVDVSLSEDYAGRVVPMGTGVDMGANEYDTTLSIDVAEHVASVTIN